MTRPSFRQLMISLILTVASSVGCVAEAPPHAAGPIAPAPPAPAPAPSPSSREGRIEPFPLKLVATDANGVTRSAELLADGTLMLDGKKLAELADNRILGKDGEVVASADGEVTVSRLTDVGRFTPSGDLVDGQGRGLRIDDTGAVFHLTREGGPDPFPGRLEGFTPRARRTALLFIVAVMAFGPSASAAR